MNKTPSLPSLLQTVPKAVRTSKAAHFLPLLDTFLWKHLQAPWGKKSSYTQWSEGGLGEMLRLSALHNLALNFGSYCHSAWLSLAPFIHPQIYVIYIQYFAQRMHVLDIEDARMKSAPQVLKVVEGRGQVTTKQASSSEVVRKACRAMGTHTGPGPLWWASG